MYKYLKIVITGCAILLYVSIAFIGCGGVKVKPTALEKIGAPEGAYKGGGAFKGEKEQAFYGVGLSSGIQNRALAITTADNRARNEIAKRFEVFISSLMKDYAVSTTAAEFKNTAEEQHVEQAIKTVTSMTLSGVENVLSLSKGICRIPPRLNRNVLYQFLLWKSVILVNNKDC